jgi:hypothetical protein
MNMTTAETEIARRLHAGEHVLLVGAVKTNLPTALAEHRQVQLWDSEGPKRRYVPDSARIVLFTKWVGHNQHRLIRTEAAKDKQRLVLAELLGTGEIRRLLKPLLGVEQVNGVTIRETAPEVFDYVLPAQGPSVTTLECGCQTMAGVTWGGTVREFVQKHWSDEVEHVFGWQLREAKRLHRLAAQHGLTTAVNYIEKIISVLNTERTRDRDEQRLSEERTRMAAETLAREQAEQQRRHAAETPVAPKVVEVPAVVQAVAVVTAPQDDMSELLRMIDDAQAVLGLARETIVRLAKDNAANRSLRERIKARLTAALDAE